MFNGSTVFNYKNDLNAILVILTYLAMYIPSYFISLQANLILKHTVHLIKNLKIKAHCPLNQNLSLS